MTSVRAQRPISSAKISSLDDRDAGPRHGIALGGDLAELAADDEDGVGRLQNIVGGARVAAKEAQGQGVGAGNGALARKGVGDGDRLVFGEGGQGILSSREMDPAAGQDDRPPRLAE